MKLNMKQKMLLWILFPVLLGLGAISYTDYLGARKAIEAQIESDIRIIVSSQANQLRSVQQTLTGGLRSVPQLTCFQNLVNAAEAGAAPEELMRLGKEASAKAAELVKEFVMIYSMAIVDTKGKVLAHSVPKNIGAYYGDRQYFKNAMQSDEVQVQNIVSRATGIQATVLAASFKDAGGKRVGIIMMTMDNAALARMTTNQLRTGSKGHCYAYNAEGAIALHSDKSLIGRDDSQLEHVRYLLQMGTGRTSYKDQDDERIIYFQALPSMKWIVVMDVSSAEVFAPLHRMLRNSLMILALFILLVGAVVFLNVRSIAAYIHASSQIAKDIAEGNLVFSDELNRILEKALKRNDELSILAAAFREMRDNIERLLKEGEQKTQEAVQAMERALQAQTLAEEASKKAESARQDGMHAAASRLEGIVNTLTSASAQLADQVNQVNSTAMTSAKHLSESAAAITQMNVSVQHVAQNVENAALMTDTMRNKTDSITDIVKQSLNSIDRVHGVTTHLKDDMQKLTEHARNINQIMGVISDIADQTNLLALNAAIEAARAGDAGRGFAVVADEVRKLAEKTMASTTDVGNAIRAIQESSAESMRIMDSTVEEVEHTTVLARQSGDALQDIVKDISLAAELVKGIADASREQSSTSEEINSSVEHLNTISAQTAEAMNEANKAINELARQTQELSGIITEMKNS